MDIQLTREQIQQRIKQIGREVFNNQLKENAELSTENKTDENIESVRGVRREETTE